MLIPAQLGRLVVLIMAVGMTGHLALRMVGARWGLPLAGFMAGFASSTAAVVGFGHRARAEPVFVAPAAAGALFANLGSLTLFAGVVAAASPSLLLLVAWPLAAAGLALLVVAIAGTLHGKSMGAVPEGGSRAFHLSHALLLTGLMAVLLLVSAWVQRQFGGAGVLIAAAAVALVEVHAAAASLAQLASNGQLQMEAASWGVVLLLLVSSIAKMVLAFASGGAAFGWRVALGMTTVPLSAALVLLFKTIV